MVDVRSQLERRAERGELRRAGEVYRRARAQAEDSHWEPNRPGRRRVLAGVAAIAVAAAAVAFVEAGRGGQRLVSAQPATTKEALGVERPAALVWVDGRGVVEGDPVTGTQQLLRAASGACQDCPGVRLGRYLFVSQPRILRVDTATGQVQDLGAGLLVFPHPDGASLYVVVSRDATASTTATTVERIDVNGRVLGGPWTIPAGQVLSSPPRAVTGGILTQTNQNAQDHTLSVWDPATARLSPVGRFRDVIDTYTSPGAAESLVAYTAAGCPTVGCGLMIARLPGGPTRRIAAPRGAPGFIGGGAFSPDGDQLAVFVDRIPETVNPGGNLVIVNASTAAATVIAGSTLGFGEPYGFATWSPNGNWVYFGGNSPTLKAHYRDSPDAIDLSLPAYYSVVAGTPTPPAPRTSTDTWPSAASLLARPLRFPSLSAGQSCPATPGQTINNSLFGGVALGNGKVRVLVANGGDVLHGQPTLGTTAVPGWFALQTLWFTMPGYDGPFVVRGTRLGASGTIEVHPGDGGQAPGSGPLVVPAGPTANTQDGYRTQPGSTWVTSPGCYAWQVDGQNFTEVIIVNARPH